MRVPLTIHRRGRGERRPWVRRRGTRRHGFAAAEGNGETVVYYLIICRSLTYAQRMAHLLERAGISGYVMRAPKLIASEGCAYCVKVAERRLADTLKLLQREGMAPKQVFLQSADGAYREVQP